ncbi:hypothetical protein ACLOJK_032697 [Asimina triloba]
MTESGRSKGNSFLLFFFFLLAGIPYLSAHIAEFDEYWQKRAKLARISSLAAYNPDPDEVAENVNREVHASLASNSTRRQALRYTGGCMATNPIDRCWRCDKDWHRHRKRLSRCALGFGRKTTGGRKGRVYVVTENTDWDPVNPKKGTLRWGAVQKKPLWIVFANSMVITLQQELMVASHKTIDGRGSNVHIAHGAGITVQFVKNVIIHNIHFHDIKPAYGGMIRDSLIHVGLRTRSDGDAISIFGSNNVWVDHNSLSRCADGLVDIIEGSTAITISNNHLTHHNDVILLGGHDNTWQDAAMQVTLAFNHFGKGLIQRMPRCRWGFFHVVNNDYTHWLMYAIGGSQHPTIISQGNRFIAPPNRDAKEVTMRIAAAPDVWSKWTWRSEGDLLMNGARFTQSGNPKKRRYFSNKDTIKAKPASFVRRLTRFAGTLTCHKGVPC